ncbi:RloB family protein [Flavobacterium hungaricum]|uniref:RloB domain-containing protein n=1 Tax=Flavobacterium hungaricum TaxID=2082725 RepID=A0ABR9TE03_9FLAO|nr:RloB family protein [Flavobacterium hungaricum]MBE8723531.1 RloB domain-containing protein [Flavobacterium hungaricum]
MRKRKINRSILIVCEGTKTEYDYFQYIGEKISIPRGVWDTVEVSTNVTIPKDIPIPAQTSLAKRKKKSFINPNKRKISDQNVLLKLCSYLYGEKEGFEKYENVKAVPLRFVALAQMLEEEQRIYEELWAVYDKDDHPFHKEASEKALELTNDKVVNIGFSSRSFEHWIILHFEKNKKEFLVTDCKDEKDEPLGCNKDIGCKGQTCLCGYIRTNTPLVNYSKSNSPKDFEDMMNVLMKPANLRKAISNAEWLREEIRNSEESNKPIYELNPFTDIDYLVKKLID